MAENFWGEPPIAIAHRGGDAAGEGQENTLKAFLSAQKMGYQYGETDVILTADGQVAAIHGSRNWLQTQFNGHPPRRALQRMTFKEIQIHSLEGVKITRLKELLEKLPDMKFFIDPKTDQVVLPLAKLLKEAGALERVCVGSFSYERVIHFQKIVRQPVSTSFIIGRGVRLVNKGRAMLKSGRLKHIEAVQLHHSLVSKEMVDLVHSHGFRALVWTANSPLSIKNAIRSGADGIISDSVALLKETLDKNNGGTGLKSTNK
jgi:glycerophosphoryl diester phosphodiesterase